MDAEGSRGSLRRGGVLTCSRNIVTVLKRREEDCAFNQSLALCLSKRCIPLSAIMDKNRELMHGHVILGFSRSGLFLISYQCSLSGHLGQAGEHRYSLHWWRFHLLQPVQHVCSFDLFPGEVFQRELHLIVAQTDDEKHILVHGCMQSLMSESIRTCHIAILSTPCVNHPQVELQWTAIHLKFDLLPPFPPLLPYLALRVSGCVILNTGDRLVGIIYGATPLLSPKMSPKSLSYSSLHTQTFSVRYEGTEPDLPSSSPSQLLPVNMFCEDSKLHIMETGPVAVTQSILDIEVWANQMLLTELFIFGLSYQCLLDYDLQIVEVSKEREELIFILTCIVEAVNSNGKIQDSYSVEIIGAWCVFSGLTEVKRVCPPTLITRHSALPATLTANALRKKYFIPTHPQKAIRAFSNHSVHSGISLQCLNHPQLPVSIILARTHTSVNF